jgi:hypothetical protein
MKNSYSAKNHFFKGNSPMQKSAKAFLTVFSVLVIFFAQVKPVFAEAATLTTIATATLGSVRFYPCAGEYIELQGDYMALFHVTFDPTGGTHGFGQNISKGIQGVGLQSGALYVASDSDRRMTSIFGAPGFETTYVDTFQLIGQGQAPDLLVQVTTHLTYAPNQGFTAQVSNVTSECK